ncbi:hypothetical protein N7509_002274 [Penicillium cosmopolitanum]|uniref:Uncharacterized protein n=1 Tax=Penicillium cosmopolitanum TaxID=1131564 RepID=A0A9X0BD82_9EURO|nr:uncharacterized protein N7509_002274 [Penicillium cosmopolitanum]KAJ5408391.1 hypothetical protein N7509_002274 [Penicillium cosmopolitanum]
MAREKGLRPYQLDNKLTPSVFFLGLPTLETQASHFRRFSGVLAPRALGPFGVCIAPTPGSMALAASTHFQGKASLFFCPPSCLDWFLSEFFDIDCHAIPLFTCQLRADGGCSPGFATRA